MNFEFLSRTFLFQGTSPEETQHMLSCLNAEPKSYPKGSVICQVGDQMSAGRVTWSFHSDKSGTEKT